MNTHGIDRPDIKRAFPRPISSNPFALSNSTPGSEAWIWILALHVLRCFIIASDRVIPHHRFEGADPRHPETASAREDLGGS
jgi:hypothetical protein